MAYQGKYYEAPVQKSARKPIAMGSMMMRLAAVLACLVLLSIQMMPGMFARYKSTAEGSDSARVAKFEVDVTGVPSFFAINYSQDDSGKFTITVHNKSEVAVKYYLTVSSNPDVSYIVPQLDGNAAKHNGTSGWIFETVYTLGLNDHPRNHNMTFTVDWDEFTRDFKGTSVAQKNYTITIKIHVEQMD